MQILVDGLIHALFKGVEKFGKFSLAYAESCRVDRKLYVMYCCFWVIQALVRVFDKALVRFLGRMQSSVECRVSRVYAESCRVDRRLYVKQCPYWAIQACLGVFVKASAGFFGAYAASCDL